MHSFRRLIIAAAILLAITIWGTAGFMILEGYTFIEALYMCVITMTTIGFEEVHPLSDAGMVFTIVLAFMGTGLLLLYVGILTQFIVEGNINRIFGRRKVERAVARIKDHYIVCGAGRIGALIIQELLNHKVRFVVIEKNADKCEALVQKGVLVINGSASDEEMLTHAHINSAKGMVLALASDAETVYTILTARQLNPSIFLIARASEVGGEKKILMAGADRVVSPFQSVSDRMANAILRPEVVDLFEMTTLNENKEEALAMEGIAVPEGCHFANKTLAESNFRNDFNLTVVGIKKASGKMIVGPGPMDRIHENDVLVVAGRKADVENLAGTIGKQKS